MTERSVVDRQPGWPEATLVGLAPLRMLGLPAPEDATPGDRWWSLSASTDADGHLLITAEVTQAVGTWFFDVTTAARIQVAGDPPPMESDEDYDAVLRKYGSWVAHPLWDYSRVLFMQLAGPFTTRSLEVPALTPEPRYITAARRRAMRERLLGDDENSTEE